MRYQTKLFCNRQNDAQIRSIKTYKSNRKIKQIKSGLQNVVIG